MKHFITYKYPYKITSMKSLKITFSHQIKKKDVCKIPMKETSKSMIDIQEEL